MKRLQKFGSITLLFFVSLAFSVLYAPRAHAQFSVIRGVNPSQQFVNLNSDASGNIAVNCVIGCGASAGTAGVIANNTALAGVNPILIGGTDGTYIRSLLTDTGGRLAVALNGSQHVTVDATPNVAVTNTPNVSVTNTPAVTVSGTPNVSVTNSPTVILGTGGNTIGTVIVIPTTNTLTNDSGTIATGGTAQTLSAARGRRYLFIQNVSTGNLYINFTSAASAAAGSILLTPNATFVQEGTFVSSELISIFGATTGQAFTAKEF